MFKFKIRQSLKLGSSVVLTTFHKFCTQHVAGWTAQMEDVSIITENSGRLLSDSSGVSHKPGGVFSRE